MRAGPMAIVLVSLGAVVLAGCGKPNPTSPSPVESGGGTVGDFFTLWSTSFVDGAEFFTTGGDPASQVVTMDVDGALMVAALFRVGGSRYVDAGTVRFGQSPPLTAGVDTLARRSVPVSGTPWYLYTSVPNLGAPPIALDGVAWHHFQVTGSAHVGAFEDSVLSVTRPVITWPAEGASVPRNSDLIVSWSDATTDTSVRLFAYVRSDVNGSIAAGVGDARDPDGHARVDFVHAYLPVGSARVTVIRYRVVHRTIGALGVVLKSEGVVHRSVTLQ